jgi:hypothetical protein
MPLHSAAAVSWNDDSHDARPNARQLDLHALRERHGTQLSLKSLRARLRCSRCGARSIETSHVWDAGPHGRP